MGAFSVEVNEGGDLVDANPGPERRALLGATLVGVVLAAGIGVLTVKWGHSRLVTLPHTSCGSATTRHLDSNTHVFNADAGALTCFNTAARACRPASVSVTEIGLDTGTRHVFTIDRSGTTCRGNELSRHYRSGGPGGPTEPVRITDCVQIAATSRGVALACGGQDLLIPLTVGGS